MSARPFYPHARLTEQLLDQHQAESASRVPMRPKDDCTDERHDITNRVMRPVFLRTKPASDGRTTTVEIALYLVVLVLVGVYVVGCT